MTDEKVPMPSPADLQERFEAVLRDRFRGAIGWRSGAHLHLASEPEAPVALCGVSLYLPHRPPSWQHDKLCPGCRNAAAEKARAIVKGQVTDEVLAAAREEARDG